MFLTYFWLTKLFILNIFPPDDLAPQQPTPDERLFGGPDEGPWVRSGMQILQTKTEVQTSNAVSFWFSPSSAGSCLLSLFLLWQKLIVSFLSSIFQDENLARTNMIDLSGKLLPCEEIETADEQIFLGKGTIAPEACLFFWYFSSCLTGLRK